MANRFSLLFDMAYLVILDEKAIARSLGWLSNVSARLRLIKSFSVKTLIAKILKLSQLGLFFCFFSVQANGISDNCRGQRMPGLEALNPQLQCAILIDDDLRFPRNIAVQGNDIWLIDKGSNLFDNGNKTGALYRYVKKENIYFKHQILNGLDDPNDLAVRQHSNGESWLYFTTRRKVQRFKIEPTRLTDDVILETVIDKLSTHGWHKLLAMYVSPENLFLTMPSSSDHCEVMDLPELVTYPCHEELEGTAQIRSYTFDGDDRLSAEYEVVATGLRDALAVQLTPDAKKLVVADNGWDQVNLDGTEFEYETTPRDEINIIDLADSHHFGWPYCFNNSRVTPPYRRFVPSCDSYQEPSILLDAHSAPLNMLYFQGELLINLHGNNDSGSKTIAFSLNVDGLPVSPPRVKVTWVKQHNKRSRPLGLSVLSETELLVTDDWNHQLIKLVFKTDKPS